MSTTLKHRRQWQLQEGSRGSLHRLRSQLAEDGCSNSQVILAKNLLQESESCIGSFENAEVAVHWLIQASDQANQEATDLLKNCLRHGKGITDRNYRHVEECINRSLGEKQYRKAAHDFFCSLTSASGHDFVSRQQLKQEAFKVSRGLPLGGSVENNHFTAFNDADNYGLTLREIQRIATGIYKGQTPKLKLQQDDQTNLLKGSKISFLPSEAISDTYNKLLELAAKQGQYVFIRWFLPTNQFHAIGLVLLYSMFTTQTLLRLLPIVLCYITMLVMVVSTLQMLRNRRSFIDLKLWTQILAYFNPLIKVTDAESKYCWNSISPYIQYIVSTVVAVLVLPSTSAPWVPYSEFSISSFIMMTCTFLSLNDKHNSVIILSTLCCIVSSLPQMLSSKNLPSYFAFILKNANFSNIYLGYGVELNLSVFSICYVIIIVCCVYMVWEDPVLLSHKVLLPHVVCLMWWQITVQFSAYTSFSSLLNTLFTWSIVCVLLWLVGWLITLLISVAFIVVVVLSKESYVKLFITIFLITLPVVLSWWANVRKTSKWLNFAQKYRYVFIIIAFGSIFAPIITRSRLIGASYGSNTEANASSSLQWNDYYDQCHKPAWQRSSMAIVEVKCSTLIHTIVKWQGTVNMVRVINIENQMEKFLAVLPSMLADWLRCLYGEAETSHSDMVKLYHQSRLKCNLEKWNEYRFEIVLRMPAEGSIDIFVDVDHAFIKYILGLQRGDIINVKGELTSDLGGSRLRLTMIESSCHQCSNKFLQAIEVPSLTYNVGDRLLAAARSCFTFFFAPLLNYHPIIPSL